MCFKKHEEDGYVRRMSTFQILRLLEVQSTGQVVQDWLVILDVLYSLLKVGPVFSNCPKICSFQDGPNCIFKIQLFMSSIYKALVWHTAVSLPLRLFYATVITPAVIFLHFLLKYLKLVTAHGCFLALDVLDNLTWSGITCVLLSENGMLNYIQSQECLWKLWKLCEEKEIDILQLLPLNSLPFLFYMSLFLPLTKSD